MNIAGKMRENKLKWFEHVVRKNINSIVKKIGEIRFEKNKIFKLESFTEVNNCTVHNLVIINPTVAINFYELI